MTGRQIILLYSETRIANAFKSPSLLIAEDIAEMQHRCIAEIKEWKWRKSRIEIVCEYNDGNRRHNQIKGRKLKFNFVSTLRFNRRRKGQVIARLGLISA